MTENEIGPGSAAGTTPGSALRNVLVPLAIAAAVYGLWNTALIYPLKVFVVFLHEISHGLAAVLTGGAIERITLSAEQGGLCVTRGGWPFVVISAGYLGSSLWGALLLVLAFRTRLHRALVALVGLFTLVVTLLYVRSLFGFVYGLVTGAVLFLVARFLPEGVSEVLLKVIGMVSSLYAIYDIFSDLILRSVPASDANALARLTFVPGIVWGALWAVAALAILIAALRAAIRPGTDSSRGRFTRPPDL